MKKTLLAISIIATLIALFIVVFFCRFPSKQKDIIDVYSKEYDVPKYLVYSVINIESNFKSNEISSAGAVGLMQIMPSTAYDMARRLDMDIDYDDLFDENVNIKLGTFYLSYLLEIFDGNIENTLCAYNWGLSNVKSWLIEGNIDGNGTITNIPVDETKNYIKKYKVNKFVYQKIYKF